MDIFKKKQCKKNWNDYSSSTSTTITNREYDSIDILDEEVLNTINEFEINNFNDYENSDAILYLLRGLANQELRMRKIEKILNIRE